MKPLPRHRFLRIALVPALLLALPAGSRAQESHPLYACANRVAGEVRTYVAAVAGAFVACATNRLKGSGAADCANDAGVVAAIATADNGFASEVAKCVAAEERALCPLESRDAATLAANVTGPATGTLRAQVAALLGDLYATGYAGCARPSGAVSAAAAACGDRIGIVLADQADTVQDEYFSCELKNLGSSTACVDPDSGVPSSGGLSGRVENALEDLVGIATKCSDATVLEIGCPLGARHVEDLVAALVARLGALVQELNRGLFHSSCRTSGPGTPPPPLAPADATLEPSGRKVKVSCGQRLGSGFWGADRVLKFDSDLDCGPSTQPTDGVIVAKSGVVLSGRNRKRSITGPGSRSLRTGTGVRIAAGVENVSVIGFRKIQYFGTGIVGPPTGAKLVVRNLTLFRNIEAGIRSAMRKTRVSSVVADRNGIGLDLSGDNSTVQACSVRLSEPQATSALAVPSPGVGIRTGGGDLDGNGVSVRLLSGTTVEGNAVGVVVAGGAASLESIVVRGNLGDGIQVTGIGNRVNDVSVKQNFGNGVDVGGAVNTVESTGSDENAGAGFVVSGLGNVLRNNGSGSPSDLGNGLEGYRVTGIANRLETNRAEANLGTGFALLASADLFEGNKAIGNAIGFDFASAPTPIESNSAQSNAGDEFRIAAGNADMGGNRANGSRISFGAGGLVVP